jgi:hypothetical protein
MLLGTDAADALLTKLGECNTSPTLLFLLKLRKTTLQRTDAGSMLLDMCEELNVDLTQDAPFFHAVQRRAAAITPICPDFRSVSRKRDDAVNEFREQLHQRRASPDAGRFAYLGAFMPFCFQCLKSKPQCPAKGSSSSLFFCFATPEDGIIQMHDIMRTGRFHHDGVTFYFTQIYEHRLGVSMRPSADAGASSGRLPVAVAHGNRLAYLMLDWEVYEGRLGGRLTREEVARLCLEFPAWFCAQLFERGFVDADSVVTAVLKQKSRPVDGDDAFKHSIHTVVEVCGVPAMELAAICVDIFRPYRTDIETCQRDRTFASLSDEAVRSPWIGADIATMNGRTAFAVLFSKKSRGDPAAHLVHRVAYNRHGLVPARTGFVNPKPFKPVTPHDLTPAPGAPDPPHPDEAMWLLLQACYTVPKGYLCPLSVKAEALVRNQQNRTVSRHHAVSEGGPPPPPLESSALPPWIKSVLDHTPGHRMRHDAAGSYFKNILTHKPELSSWVPVHVGQGAMPCPVSLSMDPPVRHQHRSNGVILVFDPSSHDTVYARCTTCKLCDRVNAHVTPVEDASGRRTPWVRIDRLPFAALLAEASAGQCGVSPF